MGGKNDNKEWDLNWTRFLGISSYKKRSEIRGVDMMELRVYLKMIANSKSCLELLGAI